MSFIISRNQEWYHEGRYANRAEATSQAVREFQLQPGECFYVGFRKLPTTTISADYLLDILKDHADEECGELAGEWLGDVTSEEVNDLDRELDRVLNVWMQKYNHKPDFFTVAEVEKFRYDGTTAREVIEASVRQQEEEK